MPQPRAAEPADAPNLGSSAARRTGSAPLEAAYQGFAKEINQQVGILERLYDARDADHIYVPDTNALIYNPNLEHWDFEGSSRFTLVLTPTVIAELDKLKVNDRNSSLRDKAKKLVAQLKEYRRRGSLTDGVTIRRDKIMLRAVAVEPKFDETLPWLDAANADDRILAGFLEIVRQHTRCFVALVTADVNLMNKADFADLPCVEPPVLSTEAEDD